MPWLPDTTRKLHFYLGLYFLWFLILFSFTGLLLNHHWSVSDFWPKRQESVTVVKVHPASGAPELMRQLGLSGEWRQDGATVQVVRPGEIVNVRADFAAGQAEVRRIRVNGWGVLHMLHTFSTKQGRHWLLTMLWTFSMDALAVGIMVMVLSGYWMWYRSKRKRCQGWVALAAGLAVCLFFLFGLST